MEEPKLFKDFVNNLKNNYHDINATKEHLDMARKDALQKIKEYKELKETLRFYKKHLTESLNYINYLQKSNLEAINVIQCCTPKGTVKTIDFERTIDLLDAEIDSLKDAYHQETIADRKTQYSSMILETLHAKKKLKQ